MTTDTLTTRDGAAFVANQASIPAEGGSQTTAFQQRTTFARRNAPSWVDRVFQKLDNLAFLAENWDSYGGRPVDYLSIQRAMELIWWLSEFVGVDEPAVGASPDGNVGFSWDLGDWSLDVEVDRDGRIHYVYLDERNSAHDRESTTTDFAELLAFLTQL